MALQKVYAAELFFFGQSFRICEDTPEVSTASSRPLDDLADGGNRRSTSDAPTMPPAVI